MGFRHSFTVGNLLNEWPPVKFQSTGCMLRLCVLISMWVAKVVRVSQEIAGFFSSPELVVAHIHVIPELCYENFW
jgi:hypothetical protein